MLPKFTAFPKIPRLNRDCVITEKIDGTNASVYIDITGEVPIIHAASRTRWITPQDDNQGFAKWVEANKDELITGLGHGHHFGEWWGGSIQRGYGMKEKRFSLFNTTRWTPEVTPKCCHVVPELYRGAFRTDEIREVLHRLEDTGSKAMPGFMNPEGIIIYHIPANQMFKVTIKNDDKAKSEV